MSTQYRSQAHPVIYLNNISINDKGADWNFHLVTNNDSGSIYILREQLKNSETLQAI